MKHKSLVIAFVIWGMCVPLFADAPTFDTQKISEITGIKGASTDEGVFKLTVPRKDVSIHVDRWKIPPFMGITSWVAFTQGRQKEVMLMGDLVLFQDEVNPVMDVLFEGGLEVTTLHNHFFYDSPKVYFMHIGGEGSLQATSETIKKAFDKIKEIRHKHKHPKETFGVSKISSKNKISYGPLEEIFGQKGLSQDGMFKVLFGRQANMNCGCQIGKDMGVNTWAAFAGNDDHAVVMGDFALLDEEVQPTLKILRASGINIVALHHHMIGESPKYYFAHYWGQGKAKDLAQTLKEAMEVQRK